jgi:hypothetical protein
MHVTVLLLRGTSIAPLPVLCPRPLDVLVAQAEDGAGGAARRLGAGSAGAFLIL